MSITAVPHLVTVSPTGPYTVNLARLNPHVSILSIEKVKDAIARPAPPEHGPRRGTHCRVKARKGHGTQGSRQASQARSIPGSRGKGIAQIPGVIMVLQWAPATTSAATGQCGQRGLLLAKLVRGSAP
jgi:hypothetical protein